MNNLEVLRVHHFDKKIRLGTRGDGGYVIGLLDGDYDCYISAGVAGEESFSRDFINTYNMNANNCFGFDGSIDQYPYQYTTKITFFKQYINNFNDENNTNLDFLLEKYDNIFLKIDIEGGEYPWLLSIDENKLKKFKQIVIEFHGLTNDEWGCIYNDKVKCLQKLFKTHYIIHAHGNRCGIDVKGFPDVLELTYVNKSCFSSPPPFNNAPLPVSHLDCSNHAYVNDIDLNFYPFVTPCFL